MLDKIMVNCLGEKHLKRTVKNRLKGIDNYMFMCI
jgi:hypothetical protein